MYMIALMTNCETICRLGLPTGFQIRISNKVQDKY